MTSFLVGAATLTALVLALVIPPLLGRARAPAASARELNVAVYRDRLAELRDGLEAGDLDQDEYEAAKHDLDVGLLEDVPEEERTEPTAGRGRWLAAVLALALPLTGAGLYWRLGTPEAIDPPLAAAPAAPRSAAGEGGGQMLPSVEEMVARLEERLRSAPDDAEGWLTLGRSYAVLARYADAARAYAQAVEIVGEVPDVLVDYAEALALSDERRLTGPAGAIAARALELAPEHPKALWLNGFAALQRGDADRAVTLWTRLVALLPPESEQRAVVVGLLEQAGAPAPPPAAPAPGVPSVSVTASVRLDEALSGEVAATDTLFVFARAVDGPPMPVAIARLPATDLPATIVLDDSRSMVPTAKLSSFAKVVVGARVSRSGNPIPSSGDLQGISGIVDLATHSGPVEIRIDQRVP